MTNLYLRNIITEGPDKGYGYAVEPMSEHDFQNATHIYTGWDAYTKSLPGILVHPSYTATHELGWMQDDYEMGYERMNDVGLWELCGVEKYDAWHRIFPTKYRLVILPRTSNVEDPGEVHRIKATHFILTNISEKPESDGWYMTKWKGVPAFTEKLWEGGSWQTRFDNTGLLIGWLKPTHPTQGEDKREEVNLRPAVKWFAEQMELALRKNDHKTGWLNDDWDELHDRILEEAKELYSAAGKFHKDNAAIISEAADVANFAMMIADQFGNRYGQSTTPPNKEGERVEKEEKIREDCNEIIKLIDAYFPANEFKEHLRDCVHCLRDEAINNYNK